jgi:hypothetical protein
VPGIDHGNQIAAGLANVAIAFIEQQSWALNSNHAEERRPSGVARSERLVYEVLDDVEQGGFATPFGGGLQSQAREDIERIESVGGDDPERDGNFGVLG